MAIARLENKKISEMPDVDLPLSGVEIMHLAQGGYSVKVTVNQLAQQIIDVIENRGTYSVHTDVSPPPAPRVGQLWLNTQYGLLLIYEEDASGNLFWVVCGDNA